MLVEFSVANYRSIKDMVTFSLVKGNGKEHLENTYTPDIPRCPSLLRSAAIYGANASGKSNLLMALRTMRKIVVRSAQASQRGNKFPVDPYVMSNKTKDKPSDFEVIFISDGVRYQYGFSVTDERVHEEWLFAFPVGLKQRWFQRSYNPSTNQYDWVLGSNLRGEKQSWKNQTRSNALFLSTAVQLNSEQLKPVFDWFTHTLRVVGIDGLSYSASLSLFDEPNAKKEIIDFLKMADLGIEDLQINTKEFSPEDLPDDMPVELKEYLAKDMEGKEVVDQLWAFHKGEDKNPVRLGFDEESDGTKQLFAFAGPWLDTLSKGYVLFIDELHNHLHPNLVKFLVTMFHDSQNNEKNAQLIFTTHETSILNQDVLRRDQIWFCERKNHCATSLYPLSDFSPRKDSENLEKSYLSGRYGALPYTRELKRVSGS